MIRPLSFVCILGAVGCAADRSGTTLGEDELAGENGQDGEEAKTDAAADNFTFLEVHKSGAFDCRNPLTCISYELKRANRSTTMCNDGVFHDQCGVKAISWVNLTQTQADAVEAAIQREAEDPTIGTQVLVRGQYKIYVDFLAFEASEVWTAQMDDGSTDATYVRVHDNGRRCIDAPCGSIDEGRLNSNRGMQIDGLDWPDEYQKYVTSPGWLPNRVQTAMDTTGAIIVGGRSHGTLMHLPTTLRTVEQVFLPLE